MLHLEMTTLCDDLTIRDFAICAICRCAAEYRIDVQWNRCSARSESNSIVMLQYPAKPMVSSVVMHPHPAGYLSYHDRINNFMSEHQGQVSCEMTGTYYGRSRHRLPRREGARSAGRPGGAPQYVPAVHLPRNSRKSVPSSLSRLPPGTERTTAKAFQVAFPASHLARNSRESVPGGRLRQVALSCRPPATASPPMFWR